MKDFKDMSQEELKDIIVELEKKYQEYKDKGLSLNMARGKPDYSQTSLSYDMLDVINSQSDIPNDYCNYGILDGIDEAKVFFGDMLGVDQDHIIVGGNSSLKMMFDQISRGYTHGYLGEMPWCKQDHIKFLCPVPGYDRHFAITEHFGIEMISIPLLDNGPDMDLVEEYIKDESVKGIWCVPQYSNPTGTTYCKEVVQRFASLKPAARDFRIFWDNAYLVHHLYKDDQDHLYNIFDACKETNNEDIVFEFCSTSKVTFPGSGVAAMACSVNNKKDILNYMGVSTIGYDKLNQLRHMRYFKDMNGLMKHMNKQADILRPKFEMVLDIFDKELSGLNIASWTKPKGGYFISLNTLDGCAKDVVSACKEAGALLTNAGATYPYGKDPHNNQIRIAPSFPTLDELKEATYLLTLCIKLVSARKLLETK